VSVCVCVCVCEERKMTAQDDKGTATTQRTDTAAGSAHASVCSKHTLRSVLPAVRCAPDREGAPRTTPSPMRASGRAQLHPTPQARARARARARNSHRWRWRSARAGRSPCWSRTAGAQREGGAAWRALASRPATSTRGVHRRRARQPPRRRVNRRPARTVLMIKLISWLMSACGGGGGARERVGAGAYVSRGCARTTSTQ
jgi:hypothetical protein